LFSKKKLKKIMKTLSDELNKKLSEGLRGLPLSPSCWASPLISPEPIVRPNCRFCGKETKPLNNNGVIGFGYKEWNYVCKECGKIQ
jgi:hypothetical protein